MLSYSDSLYFIAGGYDIATMWCREDVWMPVPAARLENKLIKDAMIGILRVFRFYSDLVYYERA